MTVHVLDFLTLSVFIEARHVVRMVDLRDKGDFFFILSVFIHARHVVRMVDLREKGDFFFLILSVFIEASHMVSIPDLGDKGIHKGRFGRHGRYFLILSVFI